MSAKGFLRSGFNYFLFSPQTLGKISHLIDIFQMGWNHQLEMGLFKNPVMNGGEIMTLYKWHEIQVRFCGGENKLYFIGVIRVITNTMYNLGVAPSQ